MNKAENFIDDNLRFLNLERLLKEIRDYFDKQSMLTEEEEYLLRRINKELEK